MPNSRLYFGDATGGITASNVGSGTGIFLAKVDKDLQFKTLIAGSNVSFNVDGETITINATDAIGVEGGINLGTGAAIFSSRVGSNLEFKTINAGANVTITSDADSITISATDAIGVEGATNLGTGEGLFSSRVGSNLEFKGLVAGTNISLSSSADSIVINATGVGEVNTASNIGAGEGLFAQKVGVDLEFKSLASNDYIQISADASTVILSLPVIDELYESISFLQSDVNILEGAVSGLQVAVADLQALQSEYLLLDGTRAMTGILDLGNYNISNVQNPVNPQDAATKAYVDANAGEANTASNVGTGEGLFKQKVGVDLEFKSLIAGSNITLSPTADSVVITALNPGGDITDGQNLGAGEAVFDSKLGPDLLFKTLVAGTNISLVSDAETITISSSDTGEVNTASNIGTGSGLFAQKIGTDLQFKSIIAGSNITITEGVDSITISSTGGSGGGITGASNTSAINGVFLEQQGTTLVFKTIQSESTNIQITDNGAYLGVSTLAEVNQADNTGPTNGVFFQKQAETLVFKTIESESPNIQITDNGTYLGISCLAIDSAINLGTGVGVFSEIIGSELQFKSLSAGMNIIITDNGDSISIDASVPPSIITVEDNGVAIESSLGILNFTGSGVSVTSNGAGTVTVDITGGGGGGSYADIPIGPSLDIDWALGTTYFVDISANANFTFSNLLDGKTITVIVNNITSTNYVASFPSTKQGPGGLDNNLYANSATVYTFTRSNGVTYCSSISGVV